MVKEMAHVRVGFRKLSYDGLSHQLSQSKSGFLMGLLVCLVTLVVLPGSFAVAEEPEVASEPAPGVTLERLRSASGAVEDPPTIHATEDAARVLWALRRLPDSFWQPVGEQATSEVTPEAAAAQETDQIATEPFAEASLQRLTGDVTRVVAIRVPGELAEMLELSRLYRLTVKLEDRELQVIAAQVPEAWAKSGESLREQVEVVGVRWLLGDSEVLFASRVRWLMAGSLDQASEWPLGWRLLGETGFDCGLLEGVAKRSRGPLVAEDNEAFYGMLAAAKRLAAPGRSIELQPTIIETADLLRKSRQWVGHWLRLNLETTRFSRVLVSDPGMRQSLGSDSYWQIDGFGSLDGVRIELEAGTAGEENLVFENRFPVSLAIVELPQRLQQQVQAQSMGGRVDVSMLTEPVTVDAFFYRLWSYESEFTTSRGGRQVAPLLIATRLESRADELAAGAGQVQRIGWMLAIAVIGSILLTSLALWRVGRRDAAVRARRRELQG